MPNIFELDISNASNACLSLFVSCLLCILFSAHLTFSIIIVYQLYLNGFIILFGFHISFILLVFVCSWFVAAFTFLIALNHTDLSGPIAPFTLILFFVTAGQCDIVTNSVQEYFSHLNERYYCIKIINRIIFVILLPIYISFGPLYTIIFILKRDEFKNEGFVFSVYYQMALIILNTMMQIIIICLSLKSIPIIITILCMICIGVGITYLMIIIFFSFDLLHSPWKDIQYLYCSPFMINTELLYILNMIFIVSFMDLWHSQFVSIEDILMLFCFINMFLPNLPFYKSYWIELYCNILRESDVLQYVIENDTSSIKMDKMFCVSLAITIENNGNNYKYQPLESDLLLSIDAKYSDDSHGSNPKIFQKIIIEQYKYSQLKKKDKKQLIESNIPQSANCNVLKQIMSIIYILSSLITLISPIVWMIWITMQYNEYKEREVIFLWYLTGYYGIYVFGLMIYMMRNKMISWQKIKYVLMFIKLKNIECSVNMKYVRKYYDRFPIIIMVIDRFQYDVGMIIILYLFQ